MISNGMIAVTRLVTLNLLLCCPFDNLSKAESWRGLVSLRRESETNLDLAPQIFITTNIKTALTIATSYKQPLLIEQNLSRL
jgi:hypothetical protein